MFNSISTGRPAGGSTRPVLKIVSSASSKAIPPSPSRRLLRRGRKIKEKDEHWQQQRGLTMSAMIILTAQAAQVRGPSVEAPKFAALDRIALTDGRFILGLEVLADPLHAE